jgi:inositol oxygenase
MRYGGSVSDVEQALYVVRYHSFYAFHNAGQYGHLCDEMDTRMREVLRQFQPCDLYSKSHTFPELDTLRPYYEGLLKEFGLDKPLRFRRLTLPPLPQ